MKMKWSKTGKRESGWNGGETKKMVQHVCMCRIRKTKQWEQR